MKVSFNGCKAEFSEVLANWIAKDAKFWGGGFAAGAHPGEDRVPNDSSLKSFAAIMEDRDAEKLLELLQLMVKNRIMLETLIAFAARYKSACLKAKVQDVQDALDLIEVMGVQQK